MYTFVPNKPFGSLLEISPTNHTFLKTFNSEYNEIEVWFTDQNSKPLEIEDIINLTMVIKWETQLNCDIEYICKRIWVFIFRQKHNNLSNKYSQKLLDNAKKSTTNAIKTASKRAIQKTAGATGDLIGNKIADKITSVSKKSTKELLNNKTEVDVENATPKKRYISPEEIQRIIDELRLV